MSIFFLELNYRQTSEAKQIAMLFLLNELWKKTSMYMYIQLHVDITGTFVGLKFFFFFFTNLTHRWHGFVENEMLLSTIIVSNVSSISNYHSEGRY